MRRNIFIALVLFLFFGRLAAYGQYYWYYSYIPQIANGHSENRIFKTTFILFNNRDSRGAAFLETTASNGQPLTISIAGLGTGSRFIINLDPGATKFLQTDGAGDLATGAATIGAEISIGVSAIFSICDAEGTHFSPRRVSEARCPKPISSFQWIFPMILIPAWPCSTPAWKMPH
jgi:hypothetical protein